LISEQLHCTPTVSVFAEDKDSKWLTDEDKAEMAADAKDSAKTKDDNKDETKDEL